MNKKKFCAVNPNFFVNSGPSIVDILCGKKVCLDSLERRNSFEINNPKKEIKISKTNCIQISDGVYSFERYNFPEIKEKSTTKINRNLSPTSLGKQLYDELNHLLEVERDLATLAEIESNMKIMQHKQDISKQITIEDDDAEIKELRKLDLEIARLEAVLATKKSKSPLDYSYEYSYESVNSGQN